MPDNISGARKLAVNEMGKISALMEFTFSWGVSIKIKK